MSGFNQLGKIVLFEDKKWVVEQDKEFTYLIRSIENDTEKKNVHKHKVIVTKEIFDIGSKIKTYRVEDIPKVDAERGKHKCIECGCELNGQNKIKLRGDKYRDVCRDCHGKRVRAGKLNNKTKLVVSADTIVSKSDNFITFTTQNIISNPSHYNSGEIDLIEAWYRLYPWNEFVAIMESQIMKYTFRNRKKGKPLEDLNKAAEYKRRLEEYYQRRQNND